MPPPLKLLVFAHTPPPHHGQSYMVELMLKGFEGGDSPIQCFHVNARLSQDHGEIGSTNPLKVLRLFKYVAEALWMRFRYGVDTLYYVPAPAKRSAVFRDGIVMLTVRPFFKKTIFHWHANGLAYWATGQTEFPMEGGEGIPPPVLFGRMDAFARKWILKLLSGANLSIALSRHQAKEVEWLHPHRITVLANTIGDISADILAKHLESHTTRARHREQLQKGEIPVGEEAIRETASTYKLLYLAHCTTQKGLFDTVEAVALANQNLKVKNAPIRVQLTVAGSFFNDEEKQKFDQLIRERDLASTVDYVGFVSGEVKERALLEHDALCAFSHLETFGVTVLEATMRGMCAILSPLSTFKENFHTVALIANRPTPEAYAAVIEEAIRTNPSPKEIREKILPLLDHTRYIHTLQHEILSTHSK